MVELLMQEVALTDNPVPNANGGDGDYITLTVIGSVVGWPLGDGGSERGIRNFQVCWWRLRRLISHGEWEHLRHKDNQHQRKPGCVGEGRDCHHG